jgi:hypothetical protein
MGVVSKNVNRLPAGKNESLRCRCDCAFTALFSGKLLNGRLSRVSVGAETISGTSSAKLSDCLRITVQYTIAGV